MKTGQKSSSEGKRAREAYHKLQSQEVTRTSPKALANANIWTYLYCKDAAVAIPSSKRALVGGKLKTEALLTVNLNLAGVKETADCSTLSPFPSCFSLSHFFVEFRDLIVTPQHKSVHLKFYFDSAVVKTCIFEPKLRPEHD